MPGYARTPPSLLDLVRTKDEVLADLAREAWFSNCFVQDGN